MTLYEILQCGGWIIAILLSLVQIAPIKIYPWSWLAQLIGRAINGGDVIKEIKQLKDDYDEREAKNCRTRITRFGDEIMRGQIHSQEHYKQILLDCDYYESYCEKNHDFKNSVSVMTIDMIKNQYQEHLTNNSFMK